MLPKDQSERCRARFEILCGGEDGPVEVRAWEGMQAPSDPAAPNLVSTSTAGRSQAGKVDTDAMETEEDKPTVSNRTPIATPGEPRRGQKVNDSALWLVCLCVLS